MHLDGTLETRELELLTADATLDLDTVPRMLDARDAAIRREVAEALVKQVAKPGSTEGM